MGTVIDISLGSTHFLRRSKMTSFIKDPIENRMDRLKNYCRKRKANVKVDEET